MRLTRPPVEVPLFASPQMGLVGDVWHRWFLSLWGLVWRLADPPTFADNAAAVAGGLKAGDFYVTSTGAVMRVTG